MHQLVSLHAGKWTETVTFLSRKGLWTTAYLLVFTSKKLQIRNLSRLKSMLLELQLLLVISCPLEYLFPIFLYFSMQLFSIHEMCLELCLAGYGDNDNQARPRLSRADMDQLLSDPTRYNSCY